MNLTQLNALYSDADIKNWFGEIEYQEDISDANDLEKKINRSRETLSFIRNNNEQIEAFVRLGTSIEIDTKASLKRENIKYLPIAPDSAAHLFLAYVNRQVRIRGLFTHQIPLDNLMNLINFYFRYLNGFQG
jgi:hypothetical protein